MCENGSLFQHRHFLHDKLLVNDESLTDPRTLARACCREDCGRLRSIVMYRRFYIMSEMHLSDFAHNVGQWNMLNHAIVYDETIGYCICGRSPYIQSLIARVTLDRFVLSRTIDNHRPLHKKVVKMGLG